MKFAVLVYETPTDFVDRTDPERSGTYWRAYRAYIEAMKSSNVAAGGTALMPPTTDTATVRIEGDRRLVQDGPISEAKEQLGGLFIIDVPNFEAALEWAARCPSAETGAVEVRPILEMS